MIDSKELKRWNLDDNITEDIAVIDEEVLLRAIEYLDNEEKEFFR